MNLNSFPFTVTDWAVVQAEAHKGTRGTAVWRTQIFGSDPAIRVRMVEYTPDYLADHWCEKGHIVLCVKGKLHTELRDGRTVTLEPGMSYQVADKAEPHRSWTEPDVGATLFIVD